MGVIKKCARCGCLYTTDADVCQECKNKDMADLSKLKGFFAEITTAGITKNDIISSTGISARNLNRYLGYEEFSGIYIQDNANGIDEETLSEGKISL